MSIQKCRNFLSCIFPCLCNNIIFFFNRSLVGKKSESDARLYRKKTIWGKFYHIEFLLVFCTFIFFILFIHYLLALQVAKSCFVPALLGHAIDDDFIRPHHSDFILEAYMVNMFARIWNVCFYSLNFYSPFSPLFMEFGLLILACLTFWIYNIVDYPL